VKEVSVARALPGASFRFRLDASTHGGVDIRTPSSDRDLTSQELVAKVSRLPRSTAIFRKIATIYLIVRGLEITMSVGVQVSWESQDERVASSLSRCPATVRYVKRADVVRSMY